MVTSWSPVVNDDPTGPNAGKVSDVQLLLRVGQRVLGADSTTLRVPEVIVC
jgi:hypothetical protein